MSAPGEDRKRALYVRRIGSGRRRRFFEFGTSMTALERRGCAKGYAPVGCCVSGMNAFFVRDDLAGARFHAPLSAENHHEPPRCFMPYAAGNPPEAGPHAEA